MLDKLASSIDFLRNMSSRNARRAGFEAGGCVTGFSLLILLALFQTVPLFGADSTWRGAGSTAAWDLPGNWSAGVPSGNDVAIFTSAVGNSASPVLFQDIGVAAIKYDNAASFTISGPGTLTINADSTSPMPRPYTGIYLAGVSSQFIETGILLGMSQSWGIDPGALLTISGPIAGEGLGFTKYAGGTLVLSGASTYTGPTMVFGGTLIVGANALAGTVGPLGNGTSPVTVGGGSSQTLLTGGPFTIGRNINITGAAATLGGNTADMSTFSGGIFLSQTVRLSSIAGGNVRFTSVISDASGSTMPGIIIKGSGAVTLSGANTFTGSTFVQSGTLMAGANAPAGANGALGRSSSAVLLGDSTGTLDAAFLTDGNFNIARPVQVQSGSTGAARLGGNSDNNSSFSGPIDLRKSLMIVQAATSGQNQLTLSGGISSGSSGTKVATFDNVGSVAMTASIDNGSGTVAVEKKNSGTLYFYSANPYTGGTTLLGGYLVLKANDALGGSSGALNFAGGTLVANNQSANIGALSVAGDSFLRFGDDAAHGNLRFTSGDWSSGTLTIEGWAGTGGASGTDDKIYFTASPNAAFLGHVQFSGYAPGATWLSGTGELVPPLIPEPVNVALFAFAGTFVSVRALQRLRARRSA